MTNLPQIKLKLPNESEKNLSKLLTELDLGMGPKSEKSN